MPGVALRGTEDELAARLVVFGGARVASAIIVVMLEPRDVQTLEGFAPVLQAVRDSTEADRRASADDGVGVLPTDEATSGEPVGAEELERLGASLVDDQAGHQGSHRRAQLEAVA